MAGYRWSSNLTQFSDDNGDPLAGGLLYFYDTGTSDLLDTYSDSALGTPNENPIELDADGRMPTDVFLDSTDTYRIVLKNSAGTTIAEDDPVAASDITAAIEVHEDDPNAHPFATTTNGGFVTELANDAEAQAKTDTARVLTPSNLAALGATTTLAGLVELATDAEAQTGTDTARAITPANLQAVTATTTRKGVSELATSAEILTGTDTTRTMTPGDFAANFTGNATSALWKFPNGYKIQVGQFVSANDDPQTVTFAEAFTSHCSGVFVQVSVADQGGAVTSWTAADFVFDRDNDIDGTPTFFYVAFGK